RWAGRRRRRCCRRPSAQSLRPVGKRSTRRVVRNARQTRLEPATMVRIDSTVTEALMHEPSDSSLLCDAVRVMTRLLEQACALVGRAAISWRDHRRLAKKRAHAIQHSRGKERKVKLYRELLAATR